MGATQRIPSRPHWQLQQSARELAAATDLVRQRTQRLAAAATESSPDHSELLAAIDCLDIAAAALADGQTHLRRLTPDPE